MPYTLSLKSVSQNRIMSQPKDLNATGSWKLRGITFFFSTDNHNFDRHLIEENNCLPMPNRCVNSKIQGLLSPVLMCSFNIYRNAATQVGVQWREGNQRISLSEGLFPIRKRKDGWALGPFLPVSLPAHFPPFFLPPPFLTSSLSPALSYFLLSFLASFMELELKHTHTHKLSFAACVRRGVGQAHRQRFTGIWGEFHLHSIFITQCLSMEHLHILNFFSVVFCLKLKWWFYPKIKSIYKADVDSTASWKYLSSTHPIDVSKRRKVPLSLGTFSKCICFILHQGKEKARIGRGG